MAIPKFYGRWVTQRGYLNIFMVGYVANISSLSIDLNSLIHEAAGEAWGYAKQRGENFTPERWAQILQANIDIGEAKRELQFLELLKSKLSKIITIVAPLDSLVIAVDGLAPVGKIQQQRQRRYKSGALRHNVGFDPNCITPGTDFMVRLHHHLLQWFSSFEFKQLLPGRFPPNFIYSSHMDPGEGEHKIMEFFRQGLIPIPDPESKHVFHGLDADLIMLTMLLPIKGALIFREDMRDRPAPGQAPPPNKFLNIDALKDGIKQEMGTQTAITDFVLLSFLAGNDFLPHQPSLDDVAPALNSMLTTYSKLNLELTKKKEEQYPDGEREIVWDIDWDNFTHFVDALAVQEPDFLATRFSREWARQTETLGPQGRTLPAIIPSKVLHNSTVELVSSFEFSFLTYRNKWYKAALGPRDAKLSELFSDLFVPTVDRVERMVLSYLSVMAWCLEYYLRGTWSVDFNLYYPYYQAPLLADLSAILRGGNIAEKLLPNLEQEGGNANGLVLTPLHQLLAVMPQSSILLIPQKQRWMVQGNGPLADLAPLGFSILTEGVEHPDEGIPLIPFADMYRIDKILRQYTSQEEMEKYRERPPHSLLSAGEMREIIQKRALPTEKGLGQQTMKQKHHQPRVTMKESSEEARKAIRARQFKAELAKKYPTQSKPGPRFERQSESRVHTALPPKSRAQVSSKPPNAWSQTKPLM